MTERDWTTRSQMAAVALPLVLLASGCMDFGYGTELAEPTPGSSGASTAPPSSTGGATGFAGGATGVGASMTVIPSQPVPIEVVDEREPVISEHVPPPISGGTLLALSDGSHALVADTDRDRLVVANYVGSYLEAIVELPRGSEPGRVIEGDGVAFVALRGTGQLATLDLATLTIAETRPVCAQPRGLALSPARDSIFVACAEGELVELPLAGTEPLGVTPIDLDVRDVLFAGDKMIVSRFRTAELLELGTAREVVARRRVPMVAELLRFADGINTLENQSALFESSLAWRAAVGADGAIVVAHQRATPEPIALHRGHEPEDPNDPSKPDPQMPSDSAYGSSSGCGGIVHTGVTTFHPDGTITTSPQLGGIVLPVDIAVSARGMVAVANAGMQDLTAPRLSFVGTSSVAILSNGGERDRSLLGTDCHLPSFYSIGDGTQGAVAVAFDATGDRLLALSREPSQLLVVEIGTTGVGRTMSLAGDSVRHTGHEIFHRDTGAGIACASCHPEGTEDGRTWNFDPLGPRRTQPLDVSLRDSAPFHWDGDMTDLGMLMSEVFVERMGGIKQAAPRVDALADWLFGLPSRPPLRAASDPAVERGKALFESEVLDCATCHSGARLSNNLTVDVGTGGPMQVPSLLGVAQRAPFMHTGCAATLLDRFNPECGGTDHGDVSGLSEEEKLDLVAYLESL